VLPLEVAALLKDALGPDELLRAVNALATRGGGGKPMTTDGDDKITRLLTDRGAEMSRGTGRPVSRGQALLDLARGLLRDGRTAAAKDIFLMARQAGAKVDVAAELSNAAAVVVPARKPAVKLAAPRLSVEQQRLIMARAQARSEGQMYKGDVEAMVKRAGFKTAGDATELSTTVAVAAPARPSFTVSGVRSRLASQSAGASGLAPGETAGRKPTKAEQADIEERIRRAGLRA
jgi:hypothetical protein